MRIATRTFLWSFVPFALLLAGSFAAVHQLVMSQVLGRLTYSARDMQMSLSRMRDDDQHRYRAILRVIGQNPALEAGVQLLLAQPKSEDAQRTVEDQLREICSSLGLDILLVSTPEGVPLAGTIRSGDSLIPFDRIDRHPPHEGFFGVGDRTYQITSVPLDQGNENLATLSVGERFDLSAFSTPVVLLRDGGVVQTNTPSLRSGATEAAVATCRGKAECEVRINGERYLSTAMTGQAADSASGYQLLSLLSLDAAGGPLESILGTVFLSAAVIALAAGILVSVLSSRSMAKPISELVAQLQRSERTGVLPDFREGSTSIHEIRDLFKSFHRASVAVGESRGRLQRAYVEFVESLASALDARDRCTAGHSKRVSEYSSSIADVLALPPDEKERVRVGALLHDIGKIGIPDAVLQKPGKLTREEFALIQEHPSIGRRILEGIHGFEPYLAAVELHHENWDGTGYPHGLWGEATPLAARIVRVADAYDAMTSDRPYRNGMSHAAAMDEIERGSGTQMDPAIVAAFRTLPAPARKPAAPSLDQSLHQLAAAVQTEAGAKPAKAAEFAESRES